MGYTTEFTGRFELDRPLQPLHRLYLEALAKTRRMQRSIELLKAVKDPLRKLVGLPIGVEGEYYVGSFMSNFPTWDLQNNYRFKKEFREIALTLLCIQKYYFPMVGKDIFITIISMLPGTFSDLELLDFNQEENTELLQVNPYSMIDNTGSVIDYNEPPGTQPELWNQWIPTPDGKGIEWDGGEKFYCYVRWLEYIINHFLIRWGYVLNGKVEFQGEEDEDSGHISVINNKVEKHECIWWLKCPKNEISLCQ